MRSNELADLAGVTVRTLRHYHQIGLLDEPDRSSNGYRRYNARHLAMVLRIVSFTNLGIPLAEVKRVIDDTAAAIELLDRIDEHTSAEIERLVARRASIAELKDGGAAPDLPAALIPYASFLRARESTSARESVYEREQLALINHFSEDATMPWLVAAFENLSLSATEYASLITAFSNLAPDASPDETEPIVDAMVDLIGSAVALGDVPELGQQATNMMLAHQESYLNETQSAVLTRALEELNRRHAAPQSPR